MFHWLTHLFKMNTGFVETWHEGDKLMVGFRCSKCGKLSGVHESYSKRPD